MTSGEKNVTREFPGGLAVRTQWFHHCGTDSIPALRTKTPHQATLLSGKKKKKKNYVQKAGLLGSNSVWGIHSWRDLQYVTHSATQAA